MKNQRKENLVTRLTSFNRPDIAEIVDLFRGLQVRRNIKSYVRVFKSKYSDSPLEPGINPSRFSCFEKFDEIEISPTVKITYGAQSIDTAIYESMVRDRFDFCPNRTLPSVDYQRMSVVTFSNQLGRVMNLLDLGHGKATCYGVPTDVIRSSDHTEGQHFSQFVYQNMPDVDGIVFASRFTEEECLALYYNRARTKLSSSEPVPLTKNIVKYAMLSKNVQVE